MTMVDLVFPVFSPQPIAADHGYALYAALSRMLPVLHSSNGVGVHPIGGRQIGNRELSLTDRSRLIVRVDSAAHQASYRRTAWRGAAPGRFSHSDEVCRRPEPILGPGPGAN